MASVGIFFLHDSNPFGSFLLLSISRVTGIVFALTWSRNQQCHWRHGVKSWQKNFFNRLSQSCETIPLQIFLNFIWYQSEHRWNTTFTSDTHDPNCPFTVGEYFNFRFNSVFSSYVIFLILMLTKDFFLSWNSRFFYSQIFRTFPLLVDSLLAYEYITFWYHGIIGMVYTGTVTYVHVQRWETKNFDSLL